MTTDEARRQKAYEDANERWPLPLSVTPDPPHEEPGEHAPEPDPEPDEEEEKEARSTLYASENFGMVSA